ncbi:MAG: hypothetical protein HY738_20845 [Bacteroidia bacterium]|nr:hypothetical protein [Bacteroidia bacterium]
MKPFKILLFISAILLVLALISIVFPKQGVRIGKICMEFADIKDYIPQKFILLATIGIQDSLQPGDTIIADTIPEKDTVAMDTLAEDSLKANQIQFPDTTFNALASFYEILKNIKNTRNLIRVLHYGDSQIEGDRITSWFRIKMQERFGGCGPGMLHAYDDNHYSISVKQFSSDNWEKYSLRKSKLAHKQFGALETFSRFINSDSDDSSVYEGWLKFEKSKLTYSITNRYEQCRIYYGYNTSTVTAEIYNEDSLLHWETLSPDNTLESIGINLKKPPAEIMIKFMGQDSPNIYAVTLDGRQGVAVDNIALRGSAGLDFTIADMNFLNKMYKMLNVKLLILQFGVNVVPNPKEDYKYYENFFYEQLRCLKKMNPELCILVIGVTDMSRKVNGEYDSYPNIEKIRDAQKNAAFKAGCAFWDLYESMGGENSMKQWVTAEPPLARKDFTHFNEAGAKKVSEMFFDAFIAAYEEYLLSTEMVVSSQ